MANILVADDDKNIRKLIAAHLTQTGHRAVCATNGAVALAMMDEQHFDLLIADIMMPEVDGHELTSDIRSVDDKMPILMVTARDGFEDKRKGFLSGVDDYMTKPLDLDEMSLRIISLLRRAKIYAEHKIEIGDIRVDSETRLVVAEGRTIELPRIEFDLLFKLLCHPQKIFTRRQLMDEIWGMDSEAGERTVDVHIKRLREKFEKHSEFEIVTVRGLGYKAEWRV
jgi:DNA-binding response OmpR family regulator